jgi:ABC-type molybdenum transport system ATPase subunit/photorepair protein PhrA
MPSTDVGLIAGAVSEIAKVVGAWMNSSDRRKLEAAKEAAEKYILTNEKDGEFKDISDERKQKLLAHYRKRFFAYN